MNELISRLLICLLVLYLSPFAFSQIEIEGEVFLTDDSLSVRNQIIVQMPFNGKVKGNINVSGITWQSLFRKVKIQAGDRIVEKVCPCPSLGCTTFPYPNWEINNVPQGTNVIFTVYSECLGADYKETLAELRPTGGNTYDLFCIDRLNNWSRASTIIFENSLPTDCDQYTCTIPPNIPDIEFIRHGNGWENTDKCSMNYNSFGVFTVYEREQFYHNPQVTSVCFDQLSQKWRFLINDNNPIKINYILDVCTTNIANKNLHLINDHLSFPSHINCSGIKLSLNINYYNKYPIAVPAGLYVPKNFIEIHEEEHFKDYEGLINDYESALYADLYNQLIPCEGNTNPEIVLNNFKIHVTKKYDDWRVMVFKEWSTLIGDHDPQKGLKYEKDVQKRIIDRLKQLIKEGHSYYCNKGV